jgi:prepilin-type N-terminal cleavage/methylation domain-containing protein
MCAPARRSAPAGPRLRDGHAAGGSDDGFTLLETIISLAIVGIVAASGTLFQTSSLQLARIAANRQVAVQMVTRALDVARAAGGAALLASPPAPATVRLNGVPFTEQWTVALCRQVVAGDDCATAAAASGVAELAKVVVSVQWPEEGGVRTQRTAALLSAAATEPRFAE